MKNTTSNPCNYPNDMWNIEPVAHIHEKAASSMLDAITLYDEVTFYQDMAQIAAQNFLHDGLYPEKAMYYETCASIYQKELFRRVIRCAECANTAGNCICSVPVSPVLSQSTCNTCGAMDQFCECETYQSNEQSEFQSLEESKQDDFCGETLSSLYNPDNYLTRSSSYFNRLLSQEFDITNLSARI